MNKGSLSLFLSLLLCVGKMDSFYYMNSEPISFRSILTGSHCTSIDYNIVDAGDGSIGGYIRLLGVHDMVVSIPGYEPIVLIKEDVCEYPNLFTMLWMFGKGNPIVQRYACVKWFLPLSFGFKAENETLTIYSSIWKYRLLAPFRAKQIIPLVRSNEYTSELNADKKALISVSVNGRSVEVNQRTVVQIYSLSALIAAGIIPYPFWPIL